MELEKIDKKKKDKGDLQPFEENYNVDHLTKIIGVFGPFHAMVYTAIGQGLLYRWTEHSADFFLKKWPLGEEKRPPKLHHGGGFFGP